MYILLLLKKTIAIVFIKIKIWRMERRWRKGRRGLLDGLAMKHSGGLVGVLIDSYYMINEKTPLGNAERWISKAVDQYMGGKNLTMFPRWFIKMILGKRREYFLGEISGLKKQTGG